MERMLSMIMRMIFRKAVNKGINAGVNRMAGGGKAKQDLSPAERKQMRQAKQTTKRARQAAKATRRLGKF
jgi:hypothetical protein